jgi:hypothetical protein
MIQLQDGIKALNDRLHAEVQKRQDGLLKQSDSLHDAQVFMQVGWQLWMPADSPSLDVQLSLSIQESPVMFAPKFLQGDEACWCADIRGSICQWTPCKPQCRGCLRM